jgi:hypothetical protein
MGRSASAIEQEARVIGRHAVKTTMADNEIIQILCALVEELAENVRRLENEIDQRKRGS